MAWIAGTSNGESLLGTSYGDVIYGNGGNDIFDGGSVSDSLYVGGDGDAVVRGGDGDDVFQADSSPTAAQRFVSFYGGNGNDRIYLNDGYGVVHYTAFVGAGDDSFLGQGAYGAVIDAGSGNDFLVLRDGAYSVVLGDGQDVVSIDSSSHQSQIATLRDFQVGGASSDRLLFGRYLQYAVNSYSGANWNATRNPFADGHARLVQSGADTLLQVDVDAGASANSFSTLVVLKTL